MIIFVKMAEFIFLALTLIRTAVYGIWTVKNQNKKGGIFVLFLCLTALSLFIFSLISDYR